MASSNHRGSGISKLTVTLVRLGFRESKYNPCVFIHKDKKLLGALWVDYLLIAAELEFDAQVF
jgi:hypothetical protein